MMNEISVLMLGGKRCGKTTVLSSMCGAIDRALAGTGMSILVDEATKPLLQQAQASIKNHMKQFEEPLTSCEVDENPTSSERAYSFKVQREVNGRVIGAGIPFKIYDIPGEWLTDGNANRVRELIKECQIILIAIDTPYLFAKMTDRGYGQYHEEYNKPIEIANFFKNTISVNELNDRLILFVPVKCERYYHLDRYSHLREYGRRYMQEVTHAVSAGYRDLIFYLRSNPMLVNHCTIAVTPILSAGGIDFISFRRDEETGKMISYFQAPEFLQPGEMGYKPKFCEQPMIYILAYMMLQAADQNQHDALFKVLASGVSREQLIVAVETLRKKMIRNTGVMAQDDGYLFIQNPKGL